MEEVIQFIREYPLFVAGGIMALAGVVFIKPFLLRLTSFKSALFSFTANGAHRNESQRDHAEIKERLEKLENKVDKMDSKFDNLAGQVALLVKKFITGGKE